MATRAVLFREMLTLDAAAVQLADVAVAGIYQLGGTTSPVVWSQYNRPDRSGSSPTVPAGQVHTMWLPAGAQVFAATGPLASADTNVSLWLTFPDTDDG
jgi:hypothetical protein